MNITDEIRYEVDGPVAILTIDRPEQRNAINPGIKRRLGEIFDTHGLNRVRIAHQDNGRFVIVGAKVSDHAEHLPQADTFPQRTLRSTLNGWSVGHRIGKRHAELDDIGPGFNQRMH